MMKKILLQAFIFWALIAPELGAQTFPAFGIIYNSTIAANQRIALGVNPQGHLNAGSGVSWAKSSPGGGRMAVPTGISYRFSDGFFYDATSPGCLCEGWGASAIDQYGIGVAGHAGVDSGGIKNLTVKNFVVDKTSIVSTVWINDSRGAPMLEVTHKYGPSTAAPNQLFQALVTITNISGASVRDVRYKRAMDWDISPKIFSELVDHFGVASSRANANFPRLLWASDNGFDIPNPLNNTPSSMLSKTINTDFIGSGPTDHGSVFTFQFGDLVCSESSAFYIYYGADATRAGIQNALTTVGASVYSLGYHTSTSSNGFFGFGFKGVSGTSVAPILPTKIAGLPGGNNTDPNIVQTYAPPIIWASSQYSQSFAYQATFNYRNDKQWAGDIKRYSLSTDGAFGSSAVISAGSLLLARAAKDVVTGSAGYTAGGRSIWTVGYDSRCMTSPLNNNANNNNFFNDSSTNRALLDALLYNCSSPGLAFTADLIAFIRGKDPYWEGTAAVTSVRPSVLADTFHSEMIAVGAPNAPYSSDSVGFGTTESYYRYVNGYPQFITDNASRRTQIYVGANDGMLHAFDEDLNERWAFIPPPVLAQLRMMVGTKGTAAGLGKSNSTFNVDGPITVKDIFIKAENKWKTVLMGGLGWGGKGYYALDITNPDLPKHLFSINNDATNKVVEYWDANGTRTSITYAQATTTYPGINFQTLGDTWSRPVIMLLPFISGTTQQKWAAIFGAGYAGGASVSGSGSTSSYGSYIYALDMEPNTTVSPISTGGQIIQTIPVIPDASSDIPNGVTANLTVITADGTSLSNTYGGIGYFTDLQGQLWKLNLSKASLSTSNALSSLFSLYRSFRAESTLANDRMGMNQLASTVVGGTIGGSSVSRLFHYFGTGDQTRIQRKVSTINNRIYGVVDPDFPAATLAIQNQTITSPTAFTNIASQSCTVSNSWYANVSPKAATPGYSRDFQKIIGRAAIYNGNVYFSGYQPDLVKACPISGQSILIELGTDCTTTSSGAAGFFLGFGLATAPVSDGKGNVYVGIGNLPLGSSPTGGVGNIARISSSASSSAGNLKYRSWREVRN